jgi:hypothetical protein
VAITRRSLRVVDDQRARRQRRQPTHVLFGQALATISKPHDIQYAIGVHRHQQRIRDKRETRRIEQNEIVVALYLGEKVGDMHAREPLGRARQPFARSHGVKLAA